MVRLSGNDVEVKFREKSQKFYSKSLTLVVSKRVYLSDPRRYEGVFLVVRVWPVPAGHHAAEPLLEAAHRPRLVEVGLSQRNVANKLLEHRLLLVDTAHLEHQKNNLVFTLCVHFANRVRH